MFRRMLFAFIALPLFGLSQLSLADTPFADAVPVELVSALLGSTPYGDTQVYSDLASAFPDIEIAEEFTVLGSADRGFSITAVVSTGLPESQASAELYSAYEAAGFMRFEPAGTRNTQTGFVHPNRPNPADLIRYCHDDLGYLSHSYQANETAGGIISISSSQVLQELSCEQQLAQQSQAMSRIFSNNNLRQFLPVLVLPEADVPERRYSPFGLGSSSSSSNGAETRANLQTEWSIDAVYGHFREQLEEQDWIEDSSNIGSSTGTANWTKSPNADVDLIGTLSILRTGEDLFELTFRAVNANSTTSRGTFINPGARFRN